MPNTVRAAWEIVTGRGKSFERTPKFGVAQSKDAWVNKKYQMRLDFWLLFEIAVAGWNLFTLIYSIQMQNWIIAFYAGIFWVLYLSRDCRLPKIGKSGAIRKKPSWQRRKQALSLKV